MKNQEKIKIIVVDDHELFRKGLTMVINKLKNSKVVAEASNGQEFLEIIKSTDADIVFMDIKMPVMNGIEASKKALEYNPDLKIIALSMFGEEEYLQKMIDAGVVGFLLKKSNIEDINRAINLVYHGKNCFSEELLSYFTKKFISPKESERPDFTLSKREIEVLQLISQGLSNQEIADRLFISKRTVDGHKANMIVKTGSTNIVNLLIYAIKYKLIEIEI